MPPRMGSWQPERLRYGGQGLGTGQGWPVFVMHFTTNSLKTKTLLINWPDMHVRLWRFFKTRPGRGRPPRRPPSVFIMAHGSSETGDGLGIGLPASY